MALAAISRIFGPNFFAKAPVGIARMMPTKVKIDINHDALESVMPNCCVICVMITGTLYCDAATAVPNKSSTTAISIQLRNLLSDFISSIPLFLLQSARRPGASADDALQRTTTLPA